MKKIALLEDHEILRDLTAEFLKSKIEVQIISYSNSKDLLTALDSNETFDIFILDLVLEQGDGLLILEKRKILKESKFIILTGVKEESVIKQCIELGSDAIISKSSNEFELLNAINSLKSNNKYYCPKIKNLLVNFNENKFSRIESDSSLTKREIEVLNLIWNNYSTEEIANKLFISYYTVETHRKSIKNKLGASTLIETLRIGLEKSYINTISTYNKDSL